MTASTDIDPLADPPSSEEDGDDSADQLGSLEPHSPTHWRRTAHTITDQYGTVLEGRRTYHGYMAGTYSLPNDGEEQTRLDMQHTLWEMVLDGALGLAPVCDKSPSYVLDIGTGTGVWANDFAERNPTSGVIGTDLSLIQPFSTPNVSFVVEDSEEEEWVFPRAFDYVHLRSMLVSLNDVPAMIKKAYDHMNPGGWIEFQDSTWELHSPDNTLEGTGMQRWSQNVLRGLARSGRDTVPNLAALKEHLLGAGFVDVEEKTFPVPGNGWMRRDPKMKALGMFTSGIIMHALESYRKIIGIAGLTDGEIDTLIDEARPDVANTRIHYFFRIHCVYGRKPEPDKEPDKEPPASGSPL